jgi:hypothetical protein
VALYDCPKSSVVLPHHFCADPVPVKKGLALFFQNLKIVVKMPIEVMKSYFMRCFFFLNPWPEPSELEPEPHGGAASAPPKGTLPKSFIEVCAWGKRSITKFAFSRQCTVCSLTYQ